MEYHVLVTIERASGWQIFKVEAKSKEAALAKFKKSGGEFVEEEVEVTELSEADLDDITEVVKEQPDGNL